jgi:hypothetical protein
MTDLNVAALTKKLNLLVKVKVTLQLTVSQSVSLGVKPQIFIATIFYCLRFETSLFVASYESQGHGGGIRPHLHTGFCNWHYIASAPTTHKTVFLLLERSVYRTTA